MWDLILTLFLAALAWFAVRIIGPPFVRFFRLRSKTLETIDFTANVSNPDIDPARYDGASDALRGVGVQIGVLHETSPPPVPWALKRLGYDLAGAKAALIGLANSLSDKSGEKAACRWDIERALKFPLSYRDRPVPRD